MCTCIIRKRRDYTNVCLFTAASKYLYTLYSNGRTDELLHVSIYVYIYIYIYIYI